MEFLDLAKRRYSSRKYKSTPVEKEKLLTVLEAGRIAPTAANKQPFQIVVVQEGDEILPKLHTVYHREWMKEAPVLIILCGDHSKSWVRSDGKDHCDIDVAIVADHITLQATEIGLATCWICNFEPVKTKVLLKLPENIEPVAILTLGYPADNVNINRHENSRKPLEETVHWGKY